MGRCTVVHGGASSAGWKKLDRLEGELNVKLAAYNKLASGSEANHKPRDILPPRMCP